MVNEILKVRVVQESSSPWASYVVLVWKDGSLRFCINYRRLSPVTRKDVYPFPRIDNLLDQVDGERVFTSLDTHTVYWQIRMHERSREKTAFATMNGLYKFHVMPFGLCNSPATFQRLMQKTLVGLGGDVPFCNVYIYDVIMFLSFIQEHVNHLRQVFDRLRLTPYPQKCQFA